MTGCSFSVLVHTREAATRSMEKVQVIKVTFKTVTNSSSLNIFIIFLVHGDWHVCVFHIWQRSYVVCFTHRISSGSLLMNRRFI